MGKMQRSKGRRAETEFKHALSNRDWIVADLSAGCNDADLIATDPAGTTYIVECKHHKLLKPDEWRRQAIEQARKHKRPWMLAYRVPGYAGLWIVERQSERPVIWG